MNATVTITPAVEVTATFVVTPAKPERITLELTREQARALHLVLRKVGGNPYRTERAHIESIYEALRETDIGYSDAYATGSIFFQG